MNIFTRAVALGIFFVVATFGLDSCGTVYSGNSQNVTITIPMKNVKLTIDSLRMPIDSTYTGVGTAFKPTLISDGDFKQVKFEADGYKTKYYSIYSEGDFQETYMYDALPKYKYCDSNTKKLFIGDVNVENNITSKTYWYKEYLNKEKPVITTTINSPEFSSSTIEDDINELLKKLNYIDTVNKVFVENLNTLRLDVSITKVTYFVVSVFSFSHPSYFVEGEVSTVWTTKNVYGDTLRKDTITLMSGRFSIPMQKDNISTWDSRKSKFYQTLIMDVVEMSMQQTIDSLDKNGFLKTEPTTISFNDKVALSKPSKTPTNIDEGMKATVTIKDKEGHGSGFLISNDGYIITNHHVVSQKNSEYTVLTNDGVSHKAKIVRSNKAIDLALLKVEGNFEYAFSFPEKQNFKIGDEVFAIGTPKSIQLGQTASKGIVAGARKNNGSNYLQTDISINSGNSGGPIMLSKNGQLAGVVEFKLVGWGTEGVSFAIPAYEVMNSLGITY